MFENPSGKPTRGKLSLLRDWPRPARELHDFIFSVSIRSDHLSHYSLLSYFPGHTRDTRLGACGLALYTSTESSYH